MKKSFNTNPVRRLLIPTDFSENSLQSVRYGVQFGSVLKSRITLFHTTHVPVFSSPEVAMAGSLVDSKMESMVLLETLKKTMVEEFQYQNIEIMVSTGFAVDEIIALSQKESMDMIIMGTKGAGGLSKILLGSNTADVIEKCSCPVLAVPSEASFKRPTKIVFATNYADNDFQTLYLLAEMFKPFNPEIIVLHVELNGDRKTENRMLEWFKGQVLTNIPYDNFSFKLTQGSDVEQTVNKFIVENDVDLLSVSNRKRNFFDKLTSRSLTKKLAYHIDMPLLAFHAHSVSSTPIF
ncbi:MAG TPA: universal stress protein [Bacteroidia bacterium]|nr:universal stress protein [Bacteroidia bacterium]